MPSALHNARSRIPLVADTPRARDWRVARRPNGIALQINEVRTVTKEVVEAARENLVIGPS